MSYQHSFVGVKITIFDVGMTISEEWLEELDHIDGLWLLPPECREIDDCLRAGLPKKRSIHIVDEPSSIEETYCDYDFIKWAIRFEFDGYSGESVSGGYRTSMTNMEHEVYQMGTKDMYKHCLSDLLALADDLIDDAVRLRKNSPYQELPPVYYLSFVTLWEVHYFQSGYEYPEWDMSCDLLGRVNIRQLANQMSKESEPLVIGEPYTLWGS